MSLIKCIKDEQLQARKVKDTIKANLLTVLISEASNVGKNAGNRETTDAEVIATIKKFIKNNEEILKLTDTFQLREEQAILAELLPEQLSTVELASLVKELICEIGATSGRDMGKVMKILKERYDGQYDGGIASSTIRQQLESI